MVLSSRIIGISLRNVHADVVRRLAGVSPDILAAHAIWEYAGAFPRTADDGDIHFVLIGAPGESSALGALERMIGEKKVAEQFQLDKPTIMDRLGGDEELFAAMAEVYLKDWGTYHAQIAAALAAGDAALLRRHAHTIKSLLATFADEAGSALAAAVEQRAGSGQLAGLEGGVARVQERLRLVAAALEGKSP